MAASNIPVRGNWLVAVGATGGACTLMVRSEVAASAITLQAGMRLLATVV